MLEPFTPGSIRALRRAESRADARGEPAVGPVDLLAALADDEEGRAGALLAEAGLGPDPLREALGLPEAPPPDPDERVEADVDPDLSRLPRSADLRTVLNAAGARARAHDRGRSVGTEHLLAALAESGGVVGELLAGAGLEPVALFDRIGEAKAADTGPIPLGDDTPVPELVEPGQGVDLGRILDASANRAREGLRVVEDYARFALDDPGLTRRLKEVRHRLAAALAGFDPDLLIGSRDTRGDVGTHIMTHSERVRENPRAVLAANFKRTAEALRSLEEYGKLVDIWLAGRFEVLRYDVYTLEKLTMTAVAARRGLGDARLMVLVGGLTTLGDLTWIVGEALAGGADAIQLREKDIPDREWLTRAREVRILTATARARFIMNDRPDLARLAGADGVHLGQDDLAPRDARRIVGPTALLGISTHDRAQLDRAVLDGAGYLGVGPVFPSATKSFPDLAGLAFVAEAAQATNIPWFAIGGIDASNLDRVLEAGARRIAVSFAVVRAESPRKAAAGLRARLETTEAAGC